MRTHLQPESTAALVCVHGCPHAWRTCSAGLEGLISIISMKSMHIFNRHQSTRLLSCVVIIDSAVLDHIVYQLLYS